MIKKVTALGLLSLVVWSCAKKDEDPFATIRPEESRFTKITLVEKLNEPMELEVLDNFDVLFIERAGKLRKYISESGEIEEIGFLDVYAQAEDGLLGLAKDPKFIENQWIYLYYSPVKLTPTQDFQDLYFVFLPEGNVSIWNTFNMNTIKFIR